MDSPSRNHNFNKRQAPRFSGHIPNCKTYCRLQHQNNVRQVGSPVSERFPVEGGVCEHRLADSRKARVEIVDKRLKSMMRELGDAINNSLSDSEEIADVIARIKAGGYDVFVVLEATIGFNQHDSDAAEEPQPAIAEVKMTPQDVKFLKSLRIRIEDD